MGSANLLIYYMAILALDPGGQITSSPITLRTFPERLYIPALSLRVVGYCPVSAWDNDIVVIITHSLDTARADKITGILLSKCESVSIRAC